MISFLVLPIGEVQTHSANVTRDDLAEAVDDFVFNLANPSFERRAKSQAESFWKTLISPFAEFLPEFGNLTIVPHGPLHGLPFEAMIDPNNHRRLFERWEVTIAPSATVLAIARRHHHSSEVEASFAVFPTRPRLGLSEKNIGTIAKLFPDFRLQKFDPAESEFAFYEKHASRARHLLIATRGFHVQGSRRATYLEIKPTPDVHDKRLTVAEIATIPLNAELVTLAACDSDRGDALPSDERLTLARSFLLAGAATVLTTRWRIPDDHRTTRFLVDFYSAYRNKTEGHGRRKDQALNFARRQAIDRGDPAEVWAAWVLVGDAR